ncbi:MAG: hypothetical protein PVS3B1_06600 [Ktedonobacteraceae bacterium]
MNKPDQRLATIPIPYHSTSPATLERADLVIVGNGIAGLTAAVEARRLDPDKRIVIITEQNHPTINTPALKQFAIGKLAREQLLAYPAGTERAERIHIVNARVEEIHAQSKYVSLSGNRGFGYESLLIATGSQAMGLPPHMPGRNFDGVLTLHRLRDYLDLRRRIGEVNEAVVVGGGVHAIETVMGLLHWGIHVHWLIRSATFMKNMLDQPASDMVLNNVRRAGATVSLETEVVGIVGRVGAVAGVITNHQEMLPCQLVLGCTGTQPAESLAEHCTVPMKHERGILVDDKLRTSVRDIYAAGDVAALKNPQTGLYEPRAQWYAAVAQGRIAGAMMVDHDELARQPFGVHWHATHLGELYMLTVGEPLSKDGSLTTLTDTSQGAYRRVTIMDDRLVGYLSLGTAQPDSLAIKRIIDDGHSVRDVIKPLLKGQFDARDYISRHRSRATRGILTQKLPPLLQEQAKSRPVSPARRITGALTALAPITNLLPSGSHRSEQRDEYQPLQSPVLPMQPAIVHTHSTRNLPQEPATIYEDEINPFTGNLPSLRPGHAGRDSKATLNVQHSASWPDDVVDELSPFTGNLPELAHTKVPRVLKTRPASSVRSPEATQERKLLPPGQHKRSHYKLWAFIDSDRSRS